MRLRGAISWVVGITLVILVFLTTIGTVELAEALWGETKTVVVDSEERCRTDILGFEQCVEVPVTPHVQTRKSIDGAWFVWLAIGEIAILAVGALHLHPWLMSRFDWPESDELG